MIATLVIALAVLAVATVPCIGIVAAIAIPSFIGYVRRSKAAEAVSNVAVLAQGVSAYSMTEAIDPSTGTLGPRGLPPSLPLTPPTQGTSQRSWPADADPLWAELGLPTSAPLYYSYEITTDRAAGQVTVRAVGDLDGDGATSEFLRRGHLDANGELVWDPETSITNELE